jgi:hypothetical protein
LSHRRNTPARDKQKPTDTGELEMTNNTVIARIADRLVAAGIILPPQR